MITNWQPAPTGYKHIVSISLGNSKRNAREELEILGQPVILERLGTDGDKKLAAQLFAALDGKISAFGLGGADLYVVANKKRYKFRQVSDLISQVKKTPVLDGSGIKNTLERQAVRQLASQLSWPDKRVLMVSAVDRFGMAEALHEQGADTIYGDFIFGLGIDMAIRQLSSLQKMASLVLPVITMLPQDWFYPTGKKQEQSIEGKGTLYYSWADIIAGDTHYIKRYAPQKLLSKTVLTQTITSQDIEWLQKRGVARLITTTPRIGNRNFATNVLEALFVALSDKNAALSQEEYLQYIEKVGFRPEIHQI